MQYQLDCIYRSWRCWQQGQVHNRMPYYYIVFNDIVSEAGRGYRMLSGDSDLTPNVKSTISLRNIDHTMEEQHAQSYGHQLQISLIDRHSNYTNSNIEQLRIVLKSPYHTTGVGDAQRAYSVYTNLRKYSYIIRS